MRVCVDQQLDCEDAREDDVDPADYFVERAVAAELYVSDVCREILRNRTLL